MNNANLLYRRQSLYTFYRLGLRWLILFIKKIALTKHLVHLIKKAKRVTHVMSCTLSCNASSRLIFSLTTSRGHLGWQVRTLMLSILLL